MKNAKPRALIAKRPAETATPVAMAVALLVCKAVGVDDAYTVGYVAIVVAFVPAAITWLVVTMRKPPARKPRAPTTLKKKT